MFVFVSWPILIGGWLLAHPKVLAVIVGFAVWIGLTIKDEYKDLQGREPVGIELQRVIDSDTVVGTATPVIGPDRGSRGGRYFGCMEPTYLSCSLRIDDREVASDHQAARVGANVIAFFSCSAELEVELQSLYVGDERLSEALVSEYMLVGSAEAQLARRTLSHAAGAITYAPEELLYDHLQRFAGLARGHGEVRPRFEGLTAAAMELGEVGVAT